jgi:hypothetical protein
MKTMSFGMSRRFRFTSEGNLGEWVPQPQAAVYAITYKQDPVAKPKSHTILYFGQSADVAGQAAAIKRDAQNWWSRQGGSPEELYVFVHAMPDSSPDERAEVQSRLIAEYDPMANN